jgi:hypothetical protein
MKYLPIIYCKLTLIGLFSVVNQQLKQKFRHDLEKHGACFCAVAVIVQLAMEGGEELMDMSEYDGTLTDAQVSALYGL